MIRRVAVTGMGVVSPHGDSVDTLFDAIVSGKSAIRAWEHPDVQPVVVASAPFDQSKWFTKLQLAGMDRVSQMAVAAAESARIDAALEITDPERTGAYIGTGMGGATAIEDAYGLFHAKGRVPPLTVPAGMANAAAAHIAIRLKISGPVFTYSVACASSAIAISEAAKAIACGEIDLAVVGGSEALLVPGCIRAWQALQTLATPDPLDPSASCRPFSENRSGLVLGEGAAFMILEPLEHARRRSARIYSEIVGTGTSCDASHLTKPDTKGQVQAIRAALRNAGLSPRDVGYCNAHGTATRAGDLAESAALRLVWDDELDRLLVSSTKALHGHLLGAAGALEAVLTISALDRHIVPANAHCTHQDPQCAIPLVLGAARELPELKYAMSNSFAFGGTNSVLIFGKPD